MSTDPTRTALGTWSGGRFMHFGEPLDDERFLALITPDAQISTVLTADVYGQGEADTLLGRALTRPVAPSRDNVCVVGAVGHDFYTGTREGAKGFPRFTDPRLRSPDQYAAYLRDATQRSLERIGIDAFDLLLLHNPDRTGYSSETVWDGMEALKQAGLTRRIGVAPGPANGFTLDLLDCFERFGARIDWAMVILNPLEPWPGELVLDAAAAQDIKVITRVVDYGGLFGGDVTTATELADFDHRKFRPEGWIGAGLERIAQMAPIAEAYGLTLLQLACLWNLAHPAVLSVVPTLVQEKGGRPVEEKRAELAALPPVQLLTSGEVERIRQLGDNTGCMALKGASPVHEGDERPDQWAISDHLLEVAARWQIDPSRDLVKVH
ncbi:MAG TPA: aldo/keto reductase [Solirubrobacteraceae bacterium]|nr:aldo/keto reductase [Solirubrobacteraceae bacterium]